MRREGPGRSWVLLKIYVIIVGTDAVVAQLAEQLIRNEQVAGSIPVNGSIFCCLV